jgi:hypothetical protein
MQKSFPQKKPYIQQDLTPYLVLPSSDEFNPQLQDAGESPVRIICMVKLTQIAVP